MIFHRAIKFAPTGLRLNCVSLIHLSLIWASLLLIYGNISLICFCYNQFVTVFVSILKESQISPRLSQISPKRVLICHKWNRFAREHRQIQGEETVWPHKLEGQNFMAVLPPSAYRPYPLDLCGARWNFLNQRILGSKQPHRIVSIFFVNLRQKLYSFVVTIKKRKPNEVLYWGTSTLVYDLKLWSQQFWEKMSPI
jgi:hypothetical protein